MPEMQPWSRLCSACRPIRLKPWLLPHVQRGAVVVEPRRQLRRAVIARADSIAPQATRLLSAVDLAAERRERPHRLASVAAPADFRVRAEAEPAAAVVAEAEGEAAGQVPSLVEPADRCSSS